MSTLLGLAVVAVAIVGVLRIALTDPDQPATMTAPRRSRKPGPAPRAAMSAQLAPAPSVSVTGPAMVGVRRPPQVTRARSVWARVRSGIALVVLVTVVGVMLAVAVGVVLVGGALAIRSAVS